MRKVVALAAVLGLLAGIYIFIASFFGLTMDKLESRAILLHLGIFAIGVPLVFVDKWSRRLNLFRGKPRWALWSMRILFLLFITIFFTFLALTHVASPKIIDGGYVLDSHGTIVAHISERDFLFLKAWELRLFASGWILAYYALMIHWWFPPQDEWTVAMPD